MWTGTPSFTGWPSCTEERARAEILTPENREAAQELAEQSFVLLKNDGHILPLKKSGIIALVRPLADDKSNLLGCWRAAGDWRQAVSVEAGISNIAGSAVTILHAKGANLIDDPALRATLKAFGEDLPVDPRSPEQLLAEAVAVAVWADVVVAVLEESSGMSGEANSRSEIGLPECQEQLLRALVKRDRAVLSQPVASVTRSVEDLRGFQKVRLEPGETREVTFRITPEGLKFYNRKLEYDWEPGEFIMRIGASSSQLRSASVRWSKQAVTTKTK